MTVQLQDVSLRRGDHYLLKHINWQVETGEHWALIGLNGSGKTTLLNLLTGYVWPTAGTVRVFGKTFGTYPIAHIQKRIGWVSSSLQERMHSKLKAIDVVISGAYASIGLYESPQEEERLKAQRLIVQLGLHKKEEQPYRTLSQGEKQRALIARALMAEPELLILDEPCTGLDFLAKEQLLETLDHLSKEPSTPTMIYVTHHIDEILPSFQKTLLLRDGEVYRSGQTHDILTEDVLSHFFKLPVSIQFGQDRPIMYKKEKVVKR